MFGLGWIKTLGIAAIIGALGFIVFMGWQYHTATQGRITDLLQKNSVLTISNATLQSNVDNLDAALEQSNETLEQLQAEYNRIRTIYEETSREFSFIDTRSAAAISELLLEYNLNSSADVSVLEAKINKLSKDSLRCFELQTGASLVEDEKNAETPKAGNSVCPWMLITD